MSKVRRGHDKERWLVQKYKAQGCIAVRTAASRGLMDVIVIDPFKREIKLIQSKSTYGKPKEYIDPKLKAKLHKENDYLSGVYDVEFLAL